MIYKYKYTTIKQQDKKDCGPACLATVANYYGHKISISKLRDLSNTDNMGTTGYGLITAAKEIGFNTSGVKVDDKQDIFTSPPLPAIAHVVTDVGSDHYIVIYKVNKKHLIISDPATGLKKIKLCDFFNMWSGFIILLQPSKNFHPIKKNNYLHKKLPKLLSFNKRLLLGIFTFSILITIFGVSSAFYYQFLVDSIIQSDNLNMLNQISIIFLIIIILKIIFESLRTLLIVKFGQKIDLNLVVGFYNHLMNLPMNFFSTRKTGEIVSRFNDSTNIREAISNGCITLVVDTLMALCGSIILYNINNKLFLTTLLPISTYLLLIILFKNAIKDGNHKYMEKNAHLTDFIIESIQGIRLIKKFNAEKRIINKTTKRFLSFQQSILSYAILNNLQNTFKGLIKAIFTILILWIGGSLIIQKEITLGTLLSFNALLVYFIDPIERIINLQSTIQEGFVAANRLNDVLDIELEKNKEQNCIQDLCLKKDIHFNNLKFRYGYRNLVLTKVNLKINFGQKIGIIGKSGSGKTTLANILMKFHPVEGGSVFIGDTHINDIHSSHLRDKISYISQSTYFFNDTILNNFLLTNPDASLEEIKYACKQSDILSFIEEQPLKFHTYLDNNASNLSAGQRQRLSIARALLKKPDILILDEATSNLDIITETKIMDLIYNFKNITVIVIAHRLSTVKNCDYIYVLNNGEIESRGTHNELMKSNSYYFNYWNL